MRKLSAALTAATMATGVVCLAVPAQAAPDAPTVQKAWLAQDRGTVGELDAGDVLKIRFTRSVVITDITSVGVTVTGDNGVTMRIENESPPYGGVFTVKGDVMTIRMNLDPVEYGLPAPLAYPLTIEQFFNIAAKRHDATPAQVAGSGDLLID